jgi:hypothetical protein
MKWMTNPLLLKEASLFSGTIIILLLWLAGRYSDDPLLSAIFLIAYAVLDQVSSRLWIKWTERMHKWE